MAAKWDDNGSVNPASPVRAGWVAGGTNSADVAADVFAMPPGMTIRYDRPANDLADYITGYHVYSADRRHLNQTDWFLPGTANIRIAIDAGPMAVSIGRRHFDPIPQVALYGPTSEVIEATTNAGILIGFGISALGWGRLFRRPAGHFRNRIVPLSDALPGDLSAQLLQALRASDREEMVAPMLDDLIRRRLGPVRRDEGLVRRLMLLIARDGHADIARVAAELGLEQSALRRLSIRHFGYPPKLLLRRARFLRSFLRVAGRDGDVDYSKLDESYFDVPHFLRDANTFLGMTPRRFLGLSTPFLDASLRARQAVLGAPTQALHDISAAKQI